MNVNIVVRFIYIGNCHDLHKCKLAKFVCMYLISSTIVCTFLLTVKSIQEGCMFLAMGKDYQQIQDWVLCYFSWGWMSLSQNRKCKFFEDKTRNSKKNLMEVEAHRRWEVFIFFYWISHWGNSLKVMIFIFVLYCKTTWWNTACVYMISSQHF